MMIRRNLSLFFGLLAAIIGLTIAVDTAFADGCCGGGGGGIAPCCNTTVSEDEMVCDNTPVPICDGQGAAACVKQNVTFYVVNDDFPKSCPQIDNCGTNCNTTMQQCKRETKCGVNKNGFCVSLASDAAVWTSSPKNTNSICKVNQL